jgi:hypothetical protein
LFEGIQRTNHDYRNDEPIIIVLQLMDKSKANLKNSLTVKLKIADCDANATGNCEALQDINFMPDQYFYESTTGLNYYFWRNVFYNSDGSLLFDGNYYRFEAIITDTKNEHDGNQTALLTYKCLPGKENSSRYVKNTLSATIPNGGACNASGYTDNIVSETNDSNESRILIDADKVLQAPTWGGLACLDTYKYATAENPLEKDAPFEFYCNIGFGLTEAQPDNIVFYVGNENSDYSKTGTSQQYIKFTIPYSLILLSDISVLQNEYFARTGKDLNNLADAVVYSTLKTLDIGTQMLMGIYDDYYQERILTIIMLRVLIII